MSVSNKRTKKNGSSGRTRIEGERNKVHPFQPLFDRTFAFSLQYGRYALGLVSHLASMRDASALCSCRYFRSHFLSFEDAPKASAACVRSAGRTRFSAESHYYRHRKRSIGETDGTRNRVVPCQDPISRPDPRRMSGSGRWLPDLKWVSSKKIMSSPSRKSWSL